MEEAKGAHDQGQLIESQPMRQRNIPAWPMGQRNIPAWEVLIRIVWQSSDDDIGDSVMIQFNLFRECLYFLVK